MIPGQHYLIEEWGNSIQSPSPVELSLGVDLAGGKDRQAPSAVWHPWNAIGEDAGTQTRIAIRAAALTVFIKEYRPIAPQGAQRCATACTPQPWDRRQFSEPGTCGDDDLRIWVWLMVAFPQLDWVRLL